jgi:hypothetical protein
MMEIKGERKGKVRGKYWEWKVRKGKNKKESKEKGKVNNEVKRKK